MRYPDDWAEEEKQGGAFLFIECKAPEKYEDDRDYLEGQVFKLAKQEDPRPENGVYYTTRLESKQVLDRALIVDLKEHGTFSEWDEEGQPSNDILPSEYGKASRVRYANVEEATEEKRPLREDVGQAEFERLKEDLHNIVWGGGGTNNNDVFVMLVRLFLCRIYDEKETRPGHEYELQRDTRADGSLESPDEVVEKASELFRKAAKRYLGYTDEQAKETTPFEKKKIAPAKVAYVVEQLQSISLTKNTSKDDTLGDFFEGIVSKDFTQTKGQFFTHVKIVEFCLRMIGLGEKSKRMFLEESDDQGRPRLPNIIDPSAGSGTFLIEAMKLVTQQLLEIKRSEMTDRQKEFADLWFNGSNPNSWAREFIYGIEPNSDLGLATKVNMILHGDGSTNNFIKSGLLPFSDYASSRSTILGITRGSNDEHPYSQDRNEQFDFILTNTPFSIDLSEDEEKKLEKNFEMDPGSNSENLFIERWYQLLKENGMVAAVLPESVLDTSSEQSTRLFLYKYFEIRSIVSLPYVAFKPFTSTKTCIVVARKKRAEEIDAWEKAWETEAEVHDEASRQLKSKLFKRRLKGAKTLLGEDDFTGRIDEGASLEEDSDVVEEIMEEANRERLNADAWILRRVTEDANLNHKIFMAEPRHVGYKRRKGLEDLHKPNDLFPSEAGKDVSENEAAESDGMGHSSSNGSAATKPTVLSRYKQGYTPNDGSLRYGFWIKLGDVGGQGSLRCDPKYHHLWVIRNGRVFESHDGPTVKLRDLLSPAPSNKLRKGVLNDDRKMIKLEDVEARTSVLLNVQEVDRIGSDKVVFGKADLAFSKLEPYLGKVLPNRPEENWIGSTEWMLYNVADGVEVNYVRFLLIMSEMLEAYRCLQSGKRHARLSEDDLLELRVPRLNQEEIKHLAQMAKQKQETVLRLREEERQARESMHGEFKSYFQGEYEESAETSQEV